MENELFFDNQLVSTMRIILMPGEKTEQYYDQYPQVVIALRGGMITRVEADGSKTYVSFPTHIPLFRPAETVEKMHVSINEQSEPLEIIVIQLKNID